MCLKTVKEVLEAVNSSKPKRCFLYFMASHDETGESWCPDCRKAQPFINKALEKLPCDAVFFTVWTGDRPTWKSEDNEFRHAPELLVTRVPTLLEFGKPRRLVESELYNEEAIVKFLTQ
uniref:Thioredoxin domain-containing protein 17 n=1 Tax=Mesocestoides corti TaxID=53468 RepID=A0A5K3FV48_MESCO